MIKVQSPTFAFDENSIGRRNPPYESHKFFNEDYPLLNAVET